MSWKKNAFFPIHSCKPFCKIKKKIIEKKRPIDPQKKRDEKIHENAKLVKIDAVNQAKEASPHTTLTAITMEDIDFSSASAGPSRLSQVASVKNKVPKWKDIDLKNYFCRKIVLFVTLKTQFLEITFIISEKCQP